MNYIEERTGYISVHFINHINLWYPGAVNPVKPYAECTSWV